MKKILMLLLCMLLLCGCDFNLGGNGGGSNEEDTKPKPIIPTPTPDEVNPDVNNLINGYMAYSMPLRTLNVSYKDEKFKNRVGDYAYSKETNEWFSIRNYQTIKATECIKVDLEEYDLYKFDLSNKLYDSFGQETIIEISDLNNIKTKSYELFVAMDSNFYERITTIKTKEQTLVKLNVLEINNTYYAVTLDGDNKIIMQNIFDKKDSEGFMPSCIDTSNITKISNYKYEVVANDKNYLISYNNQMFGHVEISESLALPKVDLENKNYFKIDLDDPTSINHFEYLYTYEEVSDLVDATFISNNKYYKANIYNNRVLSNLPVDYKIEDFILSIDSTFAFVIVKKIMPDKTLSSERFYFTITNDGTTSKLINDSKTLDKILTCGRHINYKSKDVLMEDDALVLTFNDEFIIKSVNDIYHVSTDYSTYYLLNIYEKVTVMNHNSFVGDILLKGANKIYVVSIDSIKSGNVKMMEVEYSKMLLDELCVFLNNGKIYFEGIPLSFSFENYEVTKATVLGKTYHSLIINDDLKNNIGEAYVFFDKTLKEIL